MSANMFLDILKSPWIATSRSSHWLLGVVTFTALVSTTLAATHATQLDGQMAFGLCMGMGCAGIGVWWLMLMPNLIWLGRDATALRLPRIRRGANASVWLYAALTVVPAALALALAFGHPLLWLAAFALTAATCLAFLLLPPIVWITFIIGQGIFANAHLVNLPSPTQPELTPLLALLALALTVMDAWLWRRLLELPVSADTYWTRPVLWNMHQRAAAGFLGIHGRNGDALMVRSTRRIFTPIYDVSRTGPGHPIASIRVLLGRGKTPQTMASHARNVALGIVFILVFAVLPNIVNWMNDRGDLRKVFTAMFAPPLGTLLWPVIIACLAVLLMALAVGYALQMRWTDAHGELPLLTLLPGIGTPNVAKRHLLRAILLRPLIWLGVAFVVLCGLAAMQHMLATMLVYAPLCLAASALLAISIVLGTLGGKPLSNFAIGSWTLGVLGLVGLTCIALALATPGAFAGLATVTAWLVVLALLARHALNGWRALQQRPHPFVANSP